jgi:hypothetical protein
MTFLSNLEIYQVTLRCLNDTDLTFRCVTIKRDLYWNRNVPVQVEVSNELDQGSRMEITSKQSQM